jgi:hypothetical protein
LPALSLLDVAPGADFDVEEIVLLGISQTERVALQAQLRSGETRLVPLSPQVVPAGVPYRTLWESPYLLLQPTYQPVDVPSAPLVVIDLERKVLYRIEVPRGYWVGPFVFSPNGQQVAFFQQWLWERGSEYGDTPTGPAWEVRVWDLPAGQVRVLFYADGTHDAYYPVYWSLSTGRLYLQRVIFESDAPPQELAAVFPDGSDWQAYEKVRGELAFSPDGQWAAYAAYDPQLEAGYTYYNEYPGYPFNQVWVLGLSTGRSRLLLQADDGAQYNDHVLTWTSGGLLLERFRAADHATIKEWDLLQVNTDTGEQSLVFRQGGKPPGPPNGPFSPHQERWLFWNWMDHQYTVLDLATGQMQDITPLVSGLYSFLWCEGGTALIEQWGGQVSRIDLRAMTVESLPGWTEVALCR